MVKSKERLLKAYESELLEKFYLEMYLKKRDNNAAK